MKNTKRLSASDKREKILNVATKYFLKFGYDGCTLDLVAAEAKVGKQAIYQFFDSKEHLYEEVVYAGIPDESFGDLSLDTDIESNIREYVHYLINRNAMPNIFGMIRINMLAFDRLPTLADKLHEVRRGGAVNLQNYLQELKSQNRLYPGDMDLRDLTTRFGGVGTEGVRPYMGFGWPDAAVRTENARWTQEFMLRHCSCDSGPTQKDDLHCNNLGPRERPKSMRLPQERFAHLCAAAFDLILAEGFDGMSLDQLVEETGISRATIYRNFDDKNGFFRFIMEREIFHLMQSEYEITPHDSFFNAIQNLAEQVLKTHLSPKSLAAYRLLIAQADQFPDLARSFYDAQIYRLHGPLSDIYKTYLGMQPCRRCLTGFYTLATFGLRFFTHSGPVSPQQIRQFSRDTAQIVTAQLL